MLQKSKIVTLGRMIILAGPNLDNAEMVSKHLGVRSVHLVCLFLIKLKSILLLEKIQMLKDCAVETNVPNDKDLFPCLIITPDCDESTSLFLRILNSGWLDLLSIKGKDIESV